MGTPTPPAVKETADPPTPPDVQMETADRDPPTPPDVQMGEVSKDREREFTCIVCGVQFTAKRRTALYHSNACKQKLYRERRKNNGK